MLARVLIRIVLVVILLMVLQARVGDAQSEVTITLDSLTLAVGESGVVAARIDCPIEGGCAAFDVTVRYDPAIVRVDSADVGPYLGESISPANTVDHASGTVRLAAAAMGTPPTDSEPILFRLQVTGLASGVTTLTVTNIEIGDVAANPVDVDAFAGAVVVAESAPLTPTESPESALARAQTFSGSNADWQPFESDFDGVPMVLVPAGCFTMGSDDVDDESPAHRVCFNQPFWIDQTEVTNAQYGSAGEYSGADHPRDTIIWSDAAAHCVSRDARLPTEAEWEYAARGPEAWFFPWGQTFDDTYAIWNANSPAPVGSLPAGASWVGALDLSGNVWEWVADWYAEDFYALLTDGDVNPQGAAAGTWRVIRGGSWAVDNAVSLHASNRGRGRPNTSGDHLGFRCARSAFGVSALPTPTPAATSIVVPTPSPAPTDTLVPFPPPTAVNVSTVTLESTTLRVGESAFVEGRIACHIPDGCAGFAVEVRYDSTRLTVEEVEIGPYLGVSVLPVENVIDNEAGSLRLSAIALGSFVGYGEPVLFRVRITPHASGTAPMWFVSLVLSDLDGNQVDAEGIDGWITITG